MRTTPLAPAEGEAPGGELRASRPHRHKRGRDRHGAFPPLRGLLPLVVFLTVWEALGSDRSPYFPPPSSWAQALVQLWHTGTLIPAAVDTLVTAFIALSAATVLGAFLGLVVGASRTADRALSPTLEFARAMPPAAMVPIAALLIGYDQQMKVVVVTGSAIWAILLNAKAGVRRLNPTLRDVARSLHLSRLDQARKVMYPSLLPAIFLGIRVATPVALVITLLVEILTQVEGLGALIGNAQRTYQSARVYGLILVAGLFNLLFNGLVAAIEAYALRHHPRPQ